MLFGNKFTRTRINTSGAEINLIHGGSGRPLLLLHGYPQTHVMWHKVAPRLTDHFHVVCPDLRGYGDSSKPLSTSDHSPYSKRAMAQDMVEVMDSLGYQKFCVAGHDRGARVAHRLALDHPAKAEKSALWISLRHTTCLKQRTKVLPLDITIGSFLFNLMDCQNI